MGQWRGIFGSMVGGIIILLSICCLTMLGSGGVHFRRTGQLSDGGTIPGLELVGKSSSRFIAFSETTGTWLGTRTESERERGSKAYDAELEPRGGRGLGGLGGELRAGATSAKVPTDVIDRMSTGIRLSWELLTRIRMQKSKHSLMLLPRGLELPRCDPDLTEDLDAVLKGSASSDDEEDQEEEEWEGGGGGGGGGGGAPPHNSSGERSSSSRRFLRDRGPDGEGIVLFPIEGRDIGRRMKLDLEAGGGGGGGGEGGGGEGGGGGENGEQRKIDAERTRVGARKLRIRGGRRPSSNTGCVLVPPRGYRRPVAWPNSLDEVWATNLPTLKGANVPTQGDGATSPNQTRHLEELAVIRVGSKLEIRGRKNFSAKFENIMHDLQGLILSLIHI
ncbi:hypothetical protein CBR_g44271 [Chara braunii]|uniref:Uncharacterized protein n=1 Tax=Chara braunii TaxID=69332 RepID=A0A388K2Y3_CHABU|nr:hypothetical protein CBR_g44271 [Chara braunii]|eukprot:GBG64387.1 hypothetical protein CBR_g44271 [Chara braunii]